MKNSVVCQLIKFLTIINKIRTTVDMLSGHSDRCLLWWKCPESHCARHFHQIHVCKCTPYVLNIRWTRTWKHIYGFKLCCRFSLPIGVCIDVNFSCLRDDLQLHLARVNQLHIYKGRHTKEMSVIDEHAHVAVRLQLLEMSSFTTPNQTILNVRIRYNILRPLF